MSGDKTVIELFRAGKGEEAKAEACKLASTPGFLDKAEDYARIHYNFEQLGFAKASIAFFANSLTKSQWTPDSPSDESNEALVVLSSYLASKGHQVSVFGPFPEKSRWALAGQNPRFINSSLLAEMEDTYKVGVAWRRQDFLFLSSICKSLFFMPQELVGEISNRDLSKLSGIVFLSKVQREAFMSKFPLFKGINSLVCGHGLPPFKAPEEKGTRNYERLVWTSSYGAGLASFLEQWPALRKKHPSISLEVYGSRESSGLDAGALVGLLKTLDSLKEQGVSEKGYMPVDKMNLAQASLWIHYGTGAEAYNLGLLKAQQAGLIPVFPSGGVLSELGTSPFLSSSLEKADEKLKFDNVISYEIRNHSSEKDRSCKVRGIEEEGAELEKLFRL